MRWMLIAILLCSCAKPEKYIETANKYVGLHEVENNIELYNFLEYDPVQYAWCAAFVNAALREHGLPQAEKQLLARSFLNWGRPVNKPIYGDLIIFDVGDEDWQGHVGFFIEEKDGKYIILGGNQSNKVSYKPYSITKVIGIRRLL